MAEELDGVDRGGGSGRLGGPSATKDIWGWATKETWSQEKPEMKQRLGSREGLAETRRLGSLMGGDELNWSWAGLTETRKSDGTDGDYET